MTTLKEIYQRLNLSVAEYGELLVAEVFRGTKMPEGTRGYDIQANTKKVEVKSKVIWRKNGPASVVHCGQANADSMDEVVFDTLVVIVVWADPNDGPAEFRNALDSNRKRIAQRVNEARKQRKHLESGDILWAWSLSRAEAHDWIMRKESPHINLNELLEKAPENKLFCPNPTADQTNMGIRDALQVVAGRKIVELASWGQQQQ